MKGCIVCIVRIEHKLIQIIALQPRNQPQPVLKLSEPLQTGLPFQLALQHIPKQDRNSVRY
jgi:hypothetical protein